MEGERDIIQQLAGKVKETNAQLAAAEKEKKLYVEAVKMLKLRLQENEAKVQDFAAKRGASPTQRVNSVNNSQQLSQQLTTTQSTTQSTTHNNNSQQQLVGAASHHFPLNQTALTADNGRHRTESVVL